MLESSDLGRQGTKLQLGKATYELPGGRGKRKTPDDLQHPGMLSGSFRQVLSTYSAVPLFSVLAAMVCPRSGLDPRRCVVRGGSLKEDQRPTPS